ncbi:wobble nucleotide-excising tRNase [Lachnospiraceae bacterium PF1-21]|uniref:AAA family ATPase n=1 Tax=Ohessyouella blattaphilus TaxID=2949333 RepID=UPI003E2A35DB
MINKIRMNKVASYKKEAILETDKKINLIYGLNGTGKSTISDYLYSPTESCYGDCTIEGLESTEEILVYNQHFVGDYFYERDSIPGVFTMSKTNSMAQKAMEQSEAIIKLVSKIVVEEEHKKQSITKCLEKLKDNILDEVWMIRRKYTGGDHVLEYCFEGVKKSKLALYHHLIETTALNDDLDTTISELKRQIEQLQGEDHTCEHIPELEFPAGAYETSEIFSKVIVGNKDSSVAKVIDKLQNSDWVSAGMAYIDTSEDESLCPFCQEKTLTKTLIDSIRQYFDETYQEDLDVIGELYRGYKEGYEQLPRLDVYTKAPFAKPYEAELKAIYMKLVRVVRDNIYQIKRKQNSPGTVVTIEATDLIIREFNDCLGKINQDIYKYNEKIRNKKEELEKLKNKFWQVLQREYDSTLREYEKCKEEENEKYQTCEKRIKACLRQKEEELEKIKRYKAQMSNISEAVENINNTLLEIGIDSFKIEKYSEENALYQLVRGEEENIFESLSEGEKMVISFLYFLEVCKGVNATGKTNKIIIIDDPISSLSHVFIFNIGRLIRNEFLQTEKYEQVFILTHSLYFFYELTNLNHEQSREIQKLFRIKKTGGTSQIGEMSYEEVQNDYHSYWSIIKDKDSPPALIANCMRNIIEYFFDFVEKQDFKSIFNSKELKDSNKYQSFNRYMNRESPSKGQIIFDAKEFDYESYMEAFQLVFEVKGYEKHFKQMMK